MRILGLCGTHKRGDRFSSSEWFLGKALEAARELGAETSSLRLINFSVAPCLVCNKCRLGKLCPLLEDPNDQAKEIFDAIDWADALIFSSPTYAYQQPAIVMNLLHRTIPLHEQERAPVWGTRIAAYKNNPFHGKPVGNLAVSAALGHEGTLFELFHYLKAMGATAVACAGIGLFESEMNNIFGGVDAEEMDDATKALLDMPGVDLESNECAIRMARAVGTRVVEVYRSELFQSMKSVLKY